MRDEQRHNEHLEHYAGGEIQSRHGVINRWLLGLYAVLFFWSVWYVIGPFEGLRPTFEFWGWGGLGPGLSSKGAEEGVKGLQTIGVIALSIIAISIVGFFTWVILLARMKHR
jgi:hypothetical protein